MSPTDTHTLLLETALDLIWNSNYSSVGVNEICKQAGVTKGCFYHHFESKAELFCEATNHHWESIRQDLDSVLSPLYEPLEQLEKWIVFIFEHKIGDDVDSIPGCAFFSAGMQSGCTESRVVETLQTMSDRAGKYNLALIHSLQGGRYLDERLPPEQIARLLQQYIQGAISHAQITRNLANIKRDLRAGIYRIIGLKPEFWVSLEPAPEPQAAGVAN